MKNFTKNMIHRLTAKFIVKSDLKVQPPMEDNLKAKQGHIQIWISLLRNFRSEFSPLVDKANKLKTKKMIAKNKLNNYPSHALSKISRLALTGYKFSTGVQSARAFFVRNPPMRLHIYAELWGSDTFECAGHLLSLSVNRALQLRANNYLTVISEAPISTGVHTHV